MENQEFLDPNYVPIELKVPYDIIELPSQGILYPNKKSSVKVEYLTAMDENILTSPNLLNSGGMMDVLLERKIKELGFDTLDLLEGDRISALIFLRTTGFGVEYTQAVYDPIINKVVEGVIDLSKIKHKKLDVNPDERGEFDFVLPTSDKKIKFRFLTGRDEKEIDTQDKNQMDRNNSDISNKVLLRLERQIMEIDGIRDKMKISNIIKTLPIIDTRKLKKYITDIEPGLDFNVTATIPGGGSVDTFLRFGSNFLWPEF